MSPQAGIIYKSAFYPYPNPTGLWMRKPPFAFKMAFLRRARSNGSDFNEIVE
jgi:hypothetical protein